MEIGVAGQKKGFVHDFFVFFSMPAVIRLVCCVVLCGCFLGKAVGSSPLSLLPTSWIYEESVKRYLLQDVYYLEITNEAVGEKILAEMQAQGVVDEYTQPFVGIGMPYYRVKFSVREQQAKRIIALLMSKKVVKDMEGVPLFEIQQSGIAKFDIQQSFTYGPSKEPVVRTNLLKQRQQLNKKTVRFSTQQVERKNFERQWYTDEIGLTKENLTCVGPRSNKKIKVAIIDNAFMATHPSFATSVRQTIDVADGDTDVSPPFKDEDWMHGTHSAGLIAGKKFAGQGIIGTSLGRTELYLLKATSDLALPNEITHGVEAFAKAVELDVDIISVSRGAYMDFPIFKKVIQKALDKGITIIAAAGNYGSYELFYPAAYGEVIAVGSFDDQFRRSVFSNYGSRVDVYAPGEELVVPDNQDGFAKTDGTSASAPLFAGVYAFLLHTFGKEATLTDYYLDDRDDMQYVYLHDLCPGTEPQVEPKEEVLPVPEEEKPLLIQQASTKPITGEHTVAPVIQQIEKPVPHVWIQIKELLSVRWPWMLASVFCVGLGGGSVIVRQKYASKPSEKSVE